MRRTHRTSLVVVLAVLALCVAACGGQDPEIFLPADESEQLYAPDRVIELRFEIAVADWDTLRNQHRSLEEIIFGNCLVAPPASAFTYFPAKVTVDLKDGKTDPITLERVGLRKKCFLGSDNSDKPSLKVKLDEYVEDQRLLGLRHLTLNNCNQDPSFIHQCLGYQLFAKASVPAPRV